VAQAGVSRPWRALLAFVVVVGAVFAGVAFTGGWEARLGLDLRGGTSITLTAQTQDGEPPTADSLDEAVEIIRARVNGSGVAEAEVTTQGADTIIVQVPGVGEDELVALVGTTAELRFRPVLDIRAGGGPAPGEEPDPAAAEDPDALETIDSFSCSSIEQGAPDDPDSPLLTCDRTSTLRYLLGPADIEGTDVSSASAGIPQNDVSWVVTLDFTSEGASKFFESTDFLSQQQPPQDQFAIVLDGLVVSAPSVNEPIPDGSAQISGSFTQEEAEALANVLKFGALPLTFTTSEVTTVSPTLGSDQLRAGLIAGAFGIGLVVIYALLYYRLLGIVVAASLGVAGLTTYGLVLLLGELIGFTLTLAGVAGLIVAIGITADSFVVLLERIKDEVREGRSARMAVEKGWVRARKTIIASDVVSLLAAFFLYTFSVGNVRGFAFALGLTTVVDLIVVFLFTKPVLTVLLRTRYYAADHAMSGLSPSSLGRNPDRPPRGLARLGNRLYKGETSINFVGRAKRWYAASAGLLGVAVLGLVLNGLSLGIEFTGGAEFTAQKDGVNETTIAQVRDDVVDTGVGAAANPVVTIVGDDRIRVVTSDLTPQESNEVRDAVAGSMDVATDDVTVQLVGPSWGAEITQKALQGLLFFLVAVVVYLAISFEPKMALAALAALAHDVLATVGIYALTGFDVTPASVIGFLTILGYSLYDTVVVFDKVRENTRGIETQSRYTYSEAANLAVNQTLVRSINTSVIALLPIGSILVVSLAALGTGTLKDLALALFVGVAVGTYSSIFIATPLLADLREREPVMRGLRQRVASRRAAGRGPKEPALAAAAASRGDTSGATAGAAALSPSELPGSVRDDGGEDAEDSVSASAPGAPRDHSDGERHSTDHPASVVETGERRQPQRQTRSQRKRRR
jgi:protein-export membrane protein SecD/preprotein translocase SecF subunit